MADDRWPKEGLKWVPPGRRTRGRLRVRCIEEIQDSMAETGLERYEWIQKNGDWESEDASDIKKPIHTYTHISKENIMKQSVQSLHSLFFEFIYCAYILAYGCSLILLYWN